VAERLRDATFPLLSPNSDPKDPDVKEAVAWALGKEKLKLADLAIPDARKLLFFKSEERPLLVYPHKLVIGQPSHDELNRGYGKVTVAFTLPPGAYATLVIKRLFHQGYREDTAEEIRASQRSREDTAAEPASPPPSPLARPPRRVETPAPAPAGFRAQQRARKTARKAAQAITANQLKSRKKKH
jgi:tRNA pseudouridine13 synthase